MSLTTNEIGILGQSTQKSIAAIHLPERIKSGRAYQIRTALFNMKAFSDLVKSF